MLVSRCNLGRSVCSITRSASRSFATTPTHLAEEVRIVEVGARDGLQNEKNSVSLHTKLELIRRLATTGVRDIEAGSFVAPKWVPQVRDSGYNIQQLALIVFQYSLILIHLRWRTRQRS